MPKSSNVQHGVGQDAQLPAINELSEESRLRDLSGWTKRLATLLAVGLSLYQLYYTAVGGIGTFEARVYHLILVSALIFLLYPATRKDRQRVPIWDLLLIALSVIAQVYLVIEYPKMGWRVSQPTPMDFVMGLITIVLVLEITRRSLGWIMSLLAVLVIFYALFGHLIPGRFGHPGYNVGRVVATIYTGVDGIYGTALGVMVTTIFLFIILGAYLEATGVGSFILNLANSIAGHLAGGPAKVSVISSSLFGSVSGSAIANVVADGPITIPLMKRVGYRPEVAGAIEAVTSSGGQMMPPVMGAGAFLISEYANVPYSKIVFISIIPALMYYASLYVFLHVEAVKSGLKGLPREELPSLSQVLLRQGFYLLPLVLMFVLFGMNVLSVEMVAVIAILATVLVALVFSREARRNWHVLWQALENAAKGALSISAATACAGIIVGVVGLTGLGMKFSSVMMGLAGSNLFLALVMVFLAAMVLGMGLPVVAAFIVLVTVAGTGLESLGLPLLTAYLIVFWFSQTSNITPPVCLAAYAGAAIAGSDPFRTGIQACRIGVPLYVIPFLMAYTPLLLDGPLPEVVRAVGSGFLGLIAAAYLVHRFMLTRLSWFETGLVVVSAIGLLLPSLTADLVGLLAFIAAFASQTVRVRRASHAAPRVLK